MDAAAGGGAAGARDRDVAAYRPEGPHGSPGDRQADLNNLAKAAGDALMAPASRALLAAIKRVPGGRSYVGVIADYAAVVRLVASKRLAREGGCRLVLRDAGTLP